MGALRAAFGVVASFFAVPIYEYRCHDCENTFEFMQRMSDDPKTTCESCGGRLERLISQTSFQLKGSGWYKDLYSSKKADAKPDSTGDSAASGGDSSDAPSKPESSPSAGSSTGSSTGSTTDSSTKSSDSSSKSKGKDSK